MNSSAGSEGARSRNALTPMAEATQLIRANRLSEAKTICERLAAENSEDVDALYALGWIAQSTQALDLAIQHYRSVIELKPDHARAHNNLGAVLLKKGELSEACRHFDSAIALDPAFTDALCNIGSVRLVEGAFEEAGKAYEKALKCDGDSPLAHLGLGQVFYFQDAYKEAEAELTKALELVPDFAEALVVLARVKIGLGAFEEGESLLKRATKGAPGNHRLFIELGDVYRVTENRRDAVKAYTSALKIRPDFVTALSRLSYYSREELELDLCSAIEGARGAASSLDAGDRLRLQFASARAFDQAKEYEQAWPEMVKANADFRNHYQIDTSPRTDFTRDPAPSLKSASDHETGDASTGADYPKLVFIAGMPRSGKSSIDMMLRDVPGVVHGFESARLFDEMERFNHRLTREPENDFARSLAELRSQYQGIFRDRWFDRDRDCRVFTMTVPHLRFLNHIPNIMKVAPDASVIFVGRDIWDNALRMFMYNYRKGSFSYTYRLSSIVENIRLFKSAMDWWSKAEPNRCLNLIYDDVISDPRAALAEICDFCGLPSTGIQIGPMFDDRGCAAPYMRQMEALIAEERAGS